MDRDAAMTDSRAATDAYVATKVLPNLRPLAEGTLAILREGAPEAAEAMEWGHPVLERNGLVAFLRGHKGYVSVGFALGLDHPDAHGLLEGTSATMRHVKLTSLEDTERTALRDYIAAAARAAETR